MAWEDRLREAAYTSPRGRRIEFLFDELTVNRTRNNRSHQFPGKKGTLVQDSGSSGRQLRVRAYFSGTDHDMDATRYEEALAETGTGRLEHPTHGRIDVIPTGRIRRVNDLVGAANLSQVTVDFHETDRFLNADSRVEEVSLEDILMSFREGSITDFLQLLSFGNLGEETIFLTELLNLADPALNSVSELVRNPENQEEFRQRRSNARAASKPEKAGAEILETVRIVARENEIQNQRPRTRLRTLKEIRDPLIEQPYRNPNEFHARDLIASGLLATSVESASGFLRQTEITPQETTPDPGLVLGAGFASRPDAVESAGEMADDFDELQEWRDVYFEDPVAAGATEEQAVTQIDSGRSYQQLQEAVAQTAGQLVTRSFSLPQEKRIRLTRARTIIDLSAELYGQVDERLNFIIRTNNLTGSEILELPRGRKIVYYI